MKFHSAIKLFVSVALLVLNPLPSQAGEIESKVTEAVLKGYANEQLKHQLAELVNRNHKLLGSDNPQLGTQGVKFLSKAMAAYGFLSAKTDRDRAWSATQLLLTPEPTVAAILFAAQLTDTILSMRALADIARIREQTAEIEQKTVAILKQLHEHEGSHQGQILADFENAKGSIKTQMNLVLQGKVYSHLDSDKPEGSPPTADEIEAAIRIITSIDSMLRQLETASLLIEAVVQIDRFGLQSGFIEDCKKQNRAHDALRKNISELKLKMKYFFVSSNAVELKEKVETDNHPYASRLRVYSQCISIINSASTDRFWNRRKADFDEDKFVNDCQRRFSIKGVK